MINDPKTLGLALLGGLIPSLIWLWFWLKEDNKKSEPKGLLTIIFILGMLSVVCVLPVQKFIQNTISSNDVEIVLWAFSEELFKYLAVIVIIYKSKYIEEPLDWPIYIITAALGFAALENTLFLLKPLSLGDTVVGLLTGQLRFLGSTLLHAVASASIGIALGLAFYVDKKYKKYYLLLGIIFATTLHSVFNFFIINDYGNNFLKVLSFLWVITIIVMLLFEKLRRMSP